jgi:hypothetical protein
VTLVVVVVYPPPPPPGHHNDGGDALPAALRQARRGRPMRGSRRRLNPAWLLDETTRPQSRLNTTDASQPVMMAIMAVSTP